MKKPAISPRGWIVLAAVLFAMAIAAWMNISGVTLF